MTIIFLYVYVVLPIAGRLLTDSLLSLLLEFSHIMVLQVVDFDSSVLPIAGRPATIK